MRFLPRLSRVFHFTRLSRIPKRFTALALFLVLLNAVGLLWIRYELLQQPARGLRVLSALPADTRVDDADQFALVFDEPVVPAAQVGQSLKDAPFRLEPAVGGKWRWESRKRLAYRLDGKLPAGRRFTIRPASNFQQRTGRKLVGRDTFHFQTDRLRLDECALRSADHQNVTFELTFNQPVAANALQRALKVTADESTEPIELERLTNDDVATTFAFHLDRPAVDDLRITLDEELTGDGADLSLAGRTVRRLDIPARFSLIHASARRPRTETRLTARLRFSESLASGQTLPRIDVEPAVENMNSRISGSYIYLTGPFKPHRQYTVTIGPTLRARDGKTLGREQQTRFTIPDRRESLDFEHDRGVLSPEGHLELPLKSVNVPAVRFAANRVHENNLVHDLRGGRSSTTTRRVVTRTVDVNAKQNEVHNTLLDLRQLLDEQPRGLYRIEARSTETSWRRDRAIVAVTDLALTAKQHRTGMTVWATSLHSADPVSEAAIEVRTHNNQVIARGKTDAQGLATLNVPDEHPDGEPWIVIARKDDDLSYLRLDRGQWHEDKADTDGRAWPETYEAFMYTERGVYRPGRTIHGTGIVRDKNGAVPVSFPLQLHVYRPDGREVLTRTITSTGNSSAASDSASSESAASKQGMFHFKFTPPGDGQMGRYHFTVTLPDTQRRLGETEALVEAFVPVRLEISASAAPKRVMPDEQPTVNVNARYLFDEPARGLPAKFVGRLYWRRYTAEGYEDYTFGTPPETRGYKLDEIEQKLDADGAGALKVKLPDELAPGLWQANGAATVSELGGRSVSAQVDFEIDSAKRHLGVALPNDRYVTAEQPVKVRWVQLHDGRPASEPRTVEYTLSQVHRDHVLETVDGERVWRRNEQVKEVESRTLASGSDAAARGAFTMKCPTPGRYRLTLTDADTEYVTELNFYARSASTSHTAHTQNDPTSIEIETGRDEYRPGETAQITLRAPFAGRLLVTLESDRVLKTITRDMEQNVQRIELPLSEDLRGSAFVTATLVRPLDPDKQEWRPHRAHGIQRLQLSRAPHQLPVTIDAPEDAGPGDTVQVSVRVEDETRPVAQTQPAQAAPATQPVAREATAAPRPAMVHVWAVDEGLLLPTNFQTPNPVDYFLAKRRLGVTSRDVFNRLLPDYQRPATLSRIGAGPDKYADEAARNLRRNPVSAERRAPAVIWRRAVQVDADGRATVKMQMPELHGEMRLMAVAVDGDRYGTARRALTLSSPLMVETTWPRFAAPDDTFRAPIKLFNKTGRKRNVQLSYETDGPIELDRAELPQSIEVMPDEARIIWCQAKTTGTGPVNVRIHAEMIGAADTSAAGTVVATGQATFPVRHAAPLRTDVRFVQHQVGKPLTINGHAGLQPDLSRRSVTISSSPTVELRPAMRRLMRYPYGCAEQTTSRLWALLWAPALLSSDDIDDSAAQSAEDMLAAGVDRLWSMQTRSGGIAYWPGSARANAWASAYVGHFLAEANAAGVNIEPRLITDLLTYLEERLRDTSDDAPTDDERALYCRVLATFDQPHTGWMATLTDRVDRLDMAARAHLAAAWLAAGRRDRAMSCLPDGTLGAVGQSTTHGRITSSVRQQAVLLSVLLDLDPEHDWVPQLARRISEQRKDGRWGSTLNNATALAALAKYQSRQPEPTQYTGELVVGEDQKTYSLDSSEPQTIQLADATQPLELKTKGKGKLYLSLRSEGLPDDGAFERYDRQLKVRRQWLDREGDPIDPKQIEVGDLIRVKITIAAPQLNNNRSIHNVAIVDALPGGMEVENPKLATSANFGQNIGEPDHQQFHDDRVVLFTSVDEDERSFHYTVRAVTAGQFTQPPVQASCMYDPAFASVAGGGEIQVSR